MKYDQKKQTIRAKLIEQARVKGIAFYSEVGALVGLDMGNPANRDEMSKLLGEISTDEYRQGRPMLSSVCVRIDENKRMPGPGFYDLARKLGRLNPGISDEQFFFREMNKTHDYWSGRKAKS